MKQAFIRLKAQQEAFRQATTCAKVAMAEPNVRAVYEEMAVQEHKRPYAMAFANYFKEKDRLSEK